MSAELAPGMQVRCVDARPHRSTGEVLLVVGRVYCVRVVFGVELILAGMPTKAWEPYRFEPIGRRSFEHLLSVPEPTELEPA